ncbi:MAG: ATP-binding protein [Planctomycetota bacterium]|jgi:signal transduction histidine kinase
MKESHFDEMKRFVGFGKADVEHLAFLAKPVRQFLPEIAECFYAALERDPLARAVLEATGVPDQRLRSTLRQWMVELFEGSYDREYYQRRVNIGRVHVAIQMPEHLMIAAMSILRSELTRRIRSLGLNETEAKLNAVHKLLDLELTLMLQTYHAEASDRIRAADRAELQARLAESEHLANVGQLAATLAHEIKNPLAGISGAIQVIGSSLPPGSPHKEVIGEVLSEIDRLDATARDLLIYARPKPPLRKKLRVGQLLQDTLMQLRQEPTVQGLRIHGDGLECAAEALVDDTQFRQVISNLLLNAAHACEKGGEVTFRVSSEEGMVRIEVGDTGIGIPAEAVPHTFEPFYTTKAKGTGLGLPICRWIVESHGGRIRLESERGEGTTVTIELPHQP